MGAKYFNKTSGLLTISLRDGTALVIPPKTWSEVVPSNKDGSPALRHSEKIGDVKRRLVSV